MKHLYCLAFFLLFTSLAFGQRKANNLFKNERFAEAIPHYEKALKKESSSKIQSKLATCYRKTNELKKAEVLYSEIVQRKHYNAKVMLYYGDVLMGLGRYEAAKEWFLKYAEKKPKDKTGRLRAEACDYVKTIKPYFTSVKFIPIPFNTDADDSNPTFYNGKIYFVSDRKVGFNVLKQKSGWTGRDYTKIYQVEWPGSNVFSTPEALPFRINSLNKNTGKPSFSRKGDVYFTRNTNKASKDGTYKLHIYHTRLLPNGKWKKAEELSFCQLSINYLHPAVSEDGRTLFFASNRKGGEGGMDIFKSEKIGSTWSKPVPLGMPINTPEHEAFPYIHHSGRLFFSSKGHNGFGGFDIFVSEQNDRGIWQEPINLGAPINSSRDDIGFYTDSLMQMALFSSTKAGNNDDVYLCHFDTVLTQKNEQGVIDLKSDFGSTANSIVEGEEEEKVDVDIPSINNSKVEEDVVMDLVEREIEPEGLSSKEVDYEKEYVRFGIDLFVGDTIILVAPKYGIDNYEVPVYLAKQLDQLIPAMYLTKDLVYKIYCFSDGEVDIFSQESIVVKRAEAIKEYLTENRISENQIKVIGISPDNSEIIPTFAQKDQIYILVESANQ